MKKMFKVKWTKKQEVGNFKVDLSEAMLRSQGWIQQESMPEGFILDPGDIIELNPSLDLYYVKYVALNRAFIDKLSNAGNPGFDILPKNAWFRKITSSTSA